MKMYGITLVMLLLVMGMASASGVTTDRLNFDSSENHTVTITNTEGVSLNASSTMPTGFSFVSSADGCTNPSGQTVECNDISDNASYVISSPASGTEYELSTLTTTLNGTSLNDVEFINIESEEIFNTLVEYGRGRGNYFYNSMGTSTSAGTGTGYNYVPNGTDFELNYLHKVFNIKQYFGLATSRATDVSFSCVYPYHTVVREHSVSAISDDGSDWSVGYALSRIDGSWERMGFLGMDIDSGEYDVGNTFTINCTDLVYSMDDAYGEIKVDEDSFSMEVRSPDPISVSATSGSPEIGNGTSEVLITYTITNNEVYPLDSAMVEIQAPEKASFIGVRGEIWGTSRERYVYELTEMSAGQTETITLVARFDTSSGSDTTLLLSQGVKAKFVPTWELNAYNPLTYIQDVSVSGTQSVNYTTSSEITGLRDQLDVIEANTVTLNTTINNIETLVEQINTTTTTTGSNLISINTSIHNQLTNLDTDFQEILDELSYMQGFNEELIFLVTDSVGLAKESKSAYENGDTGEAVEKLEEATATLQEAQDYIEEKKQDTENDYKIKTSKGFKKVWFWVKGLFI